MHTMPADYEQRHWHLDRKVPIAIIFTMAVQTVVFAFYVGQLVRQIDDHERRILAVEYNGKHIQEQIGDVSVRLARIEEISSYQTELLKRIDDRMERNARK